MPLVPPAVRCNALVSPLPIIHVTRRSVPVRMIEVICKADTLLVGSVPLRYSARLFRPSPSGSQSAHDWLLVVEPLPPKYCARHVSRIPSPTLSADMTVMLTVAATLLVEPSLTEQVKLSGPM